MIEIGDVVTYVDPVGKKRPALVTSVFARSADDEAPSLNLVFVSDDESQHDSYGRQISRETSVCHKRQQAADCFYWEGRP